MSKFLLLLTLCLFVVGCDTKFSSMKQAITACEKWASSKVYTSIEEMFFRTCENERETSQVLGYEEGLDDMSPGKLVKHFRY